MEDRHVLIGRQKWGRVRAYVNVDRRLLRAGRVLNSGTSEPLIEPIVVLLCLGALGIDALVFTLSESAMSVKSCVFVGGLLLIVMA